MPRGLNLGQPIWIHAVSVGEAIAIKPMLTDLRAAYPKKKFVLSTVTKTGNKIMQDIAKSGDFITYLPLDFSFIVRSVIKKVKPSLFIIAETEIWPNLIAQLHLKGVPVIMVNARISDRSFKGYKIIQAFIKRILRKINLFCVQTESDAERLRILGAPQERIRVTGNLKFDNQDYAGFQPGDFITTYRHSLGLTSQEKLLLAGSTHPGEDEMILAVYKALYKTSPGLKLLIAPRHPERAKDIANLVSACGFRPFFISGLPFSCSTCLTSPVFILDTIGELSKIYGAADIVFVGGSLIKKGGHNILEPAAWAKPVLFGPHMFNFRDIADLLLANNAAVAVPDQDALREKIKFLLNNADAVLELSQNARNVVLKNRGAASRTTELIRPLFINNAP